MALGDQVTGVVTTITVSGSVQFTCLVDGTAINAGPATLKGGTATQDNYFAIVCPTCHTRYLAAVAVPGVLVNVQETS